MRKEGLTASALALAAVFAMTMAAPSWAAPPTPCTGPLGAVEIKGNISAGPECDLSGTTVKGDVTVSPGGSLTTEEGSTTVITGNVQSRNATRIALEGATSVGGDVRLTGTTRSNLLYRGNVSGNVEIEEGRTESEVYDESIGGNVRMLNASLPATFIGLVGIGNSSVGGNLEVGNNSLTNPFGNFVVVLQVSVAGDLRVYSNSSPPVPKGRETVNVLTFFLNHVGGNAELLDNTGFSKEMLVDANTITRNLICIGNVPAPKGANAAAHKLGQCELL
jgi:hypothetical protein